MSEPNPNESISRPQKSSQRGLIVSSALEVDNDVLIVRSLRLDPQEIRSALLFWDRLAWPTSTLIHFSGGPDEQFLQAIGTMIRPEFTAVSGNPAHATTQGFADTLDYFERFEPGLWSLAQGENSLLIRSARLIECGTVQVELCRAIPVPDKDVPLAEILEFKRRRYDELHILREELDSLVDEIYKAENKTEALSSAKERVDKVCADAIRVGSEWQFPVRLANVKRTYEWRPFQTFAGAIGGYLGSSALGLPISASLLSALGGAATATAPALKFSFDGFDWPGLRPRQGPYRYVHQFHSEVF